VIGSLAGRIAASPRGRVAVLGSALLAAALVALSPGALAPAAARAALAAAGIAAVALLARRRIQRQTAAPLSVLAREPLASGSGIAIVEAEGRRLLVGFGREGVSLLADLPAPREDAP
jgi:flagellar protein FliO/FliZ